MTYRWTLTRWALVREQAQVLRKPTLFRAQSTTRSINHDTLPSSLSDNEFLDFVLGSNTRQAAITPSEKEPNDVETGKAADETIPGSVVRSGNTSIPGVSQDDRPNLRKDTSNEYMAVTSRKRRASRGKLVGFVRSPVRAISPGERDARKIRWLSLRHKSRPSADVSSAWTVNYARLTSPYDSAFSGESEYMKPLTLDDRAEEWARDLLSAIRRDPRADKTGILDLDTFRARFGERGRGVWREVTLWLLANDKDGVIEFLLATHSAPFYPPMNWVADALYHMALHYTHNESAVVDADQIQKLVGAFEILTSRPSSGEKMDMRNGFVRRLLRFCDMKNVAQIRLILKSNQVRVGAATWHHLSRYLARAGHLEVATEALLEAHALGSDINGYMFRSNCTTLLRAAVRHPTGQRAALRLLDNLLKMGVYLDKQLRGVIMLNAVDSGDMDTAMTVYKSMLANGIKPDAQTYGILLKGCRSNLDDTATLVGVIDRAVKETSVRENPILSSQILHCLCLYHSKHRTGFAHIKEAYAQLFDQAPLERLGVSLNFQSDSLSIGHTRLLPSSYDVAVMLTAYLMEVSSADAHRIYQTWRSLVMSGDEFFAPLAAKPFLANTFLYKLVAEKTSLVEAAKVVRDMQTTLPESAGVMQCAPDIYTWSILMHGFIRFKETKHAERVLAKMQELGYRPNTVTWNTLLSGYTSQHDIEGTLNTLRRLEEDGSLYNEWTYRGLSRLSERSRMKLQAEMDRRQYAKRLDFTSQLRTGLTDKLASPDISRALTL